MVALDNFRLIEQPKYNTYHVNLINTKNIIQNGEIEILRSIVRSTKLSSNIIRLYLISQISLRIKLFKNNQ